MNLSVKDSAGTPLYRQIYDGISRAVITGDIAPGEALPPIRTAAEELRVSVISVKRAWEELERDGFIVTAVGRGSVAAELSPAELSKKRRALMKERLSDGTAFCKSLGASEEEILAVIKELY